MAMWTIGRTARWCGARPALFLRESRLKRHDTDMPGCVRLLSHCEGGESAGADP